MGSLQSLDWTGELLLRKLTLFPGGDLSNQSLLQTFPSMNQNVEVIDVPTLDSMDIVSEESEKLLVREKRAAITSMAVN